MARKRTRGWARELWANPEYSIILVGAVTIAVLSLVDVIQNVTTLIAVTLGILSLIAFATLRQSARRDMETKLAETLANQVMDLRAEVKFVRKIIEPEQSIIEIPSGMIQARGFEAALDESSSWHFRGGMGSYLRTQTLPRLALATKSHAATKSRVTAQILDPADDAACRAYAAYRRKLEERRVNQVSQSWTVERVKLECMASLLAAAWFHQHENLYVEIGTRSQISTLRYDASDNILVITNEDQQFPALAIKKCSQMYYAVLADLDLTLQSSRRINLDSVSIPRDSAEISIDKLDECMAAMGVTHHFSPHDRDSIIRLAFQRKPD